MTRPDGNDSDEVKHLRAKTVSWAESVRTNHFKADDAWYCLNNTIMKTVEYPLMATTMTKDELTHVIAPILKAGLPRSKVQSQLPRALVHGSLESQGLNLHHPYHTQLIQHLLAVLRHGTRPTITGHLLRCGMESLVLELGSGKPFWDLPFELWGPLATECWLAKTWKHLDTTDLALRGPVATIPLQRTQDSYLMERFVEAGYRKGNLARLNRIRMTLHVVTVADIVSADGLTLEPNTVAGHRLDRQSPYDWPRSVDPSPSDREFWRSALRHSLCTSPKSDRLNTALGAWLLPQDNLWNWWYSPSDNRLLHRNDKDWEVWNYRPEMSNRKFQLSDTTLPTLPADAQRANVVRQPHGNLVQLRTRGVQVMPSQPEHIAPTSLSDHLSHIDKDLQWAIHHCRVPDDGKAIAEAIQSHNAIAVSDASLKHSFGTAAFVIEGKDSSNRALGINIVPGPIQDGNSYRCELAGLIGAVTLVNSICSRQDITSGSIRVACDNKSTLLVFRPGFIPEPTKESFDLVSILWTLLKQSPIHWLPEHVKGHQVGKKNRAFLTRTEILNDEMDNLAKAYWNILLQDGHSMDAPTSPLTHEGWTIWRKSTQEKLPSPHPQTLYPILQDADTIDYWTSPQDLQQTPRLSLEAIQQIDWQICRDAMLQLELPRRRWVTKHGSENCGVGITQVFWQKQEDNSCPRCGLPEDTKHVLICQGEDAESIYLTHIPKITSYMESSCTHPDIQAAILSRIDHFRHQVHPNLPPGICAEVRQAVHAQDQIGWKNFLEGLPARHWQRIQQRHYDRHSISNHTGRRWLQLLLLRLHHLAHDLWEHRNDILHNPKSQRNQAMIYQLHLELYSEYSRGPQDLPPRDRARFALPLGSLLLKSVAYKEAWLINVTSARHRQARRRLEVEDQLAASLQRSRIFQFCITGKLPKV